MGTKEYDPFVRGHYPVGVRTIQAPDFCRGRLFPCELWYPAHTEESDRPDGTEPGRDATALRGAYPLIVFSHSSGGHRRSATFICTNLRWTVLATPEVEPRLGAVVALAAGGSQHPRPGILPLKLTFAWGLDVPTRYLAAEQDTPIPLAGVVELLDRTPATKRIFILRRADHQHFLVDVEGEHEAVRAVSLHGEAAWIPAAMRPIADLCSGEQAHVFVCGLTLAHLDATLRESVAVERFLAGDVEAELSACGVEAFSAAPE